MLQANVCTGLYQCRRLKPATGCSPAGDEGLHWAAPAQELRPMVILRCSCAGERLRLAVCRRRRRRPTTGCMQYRRNLLEITERSCCEQVSSTFKGRHSRSRSLKYDVGVVTNHKSHRLFRTFILTILHQLLGLGTARTQNYCNTGDGPLQSLSVTLTL